MPLVTPFGRICVTSQPILKSHFTFSFQSSYGKWGDTDNLEAFSVPSVGYGIKIQDWTPYNSTLAMPGFRDRVPEIQLQFRMFDDTRGLDFWQKWNLYDSRKDAVEMNRRKYAGKGEITLWKSAGESMTEFLRIKLTGIWPSALKVDGLDMSSEGDPVTYTVTLQAEDVEFKKV